MTFTLRPPTPVICDNNDRKNDFIYWYFNEFVADPLFDAMARTNEINSPWHIENSIGIHTNMVVTQYLLLSDTSFHKLGTVEGAFAAAFHDVGKPAALTNKQSEERGHYVSFPGHEMRSAREWESWAVANFSMLSTRFGLDSESIYRVSWMIENHLPWAIKKDFKLDQMAMTVKTLDIYQPFVDLLWADTVGRMSVDWVEKRGKVSEWIGNFYLRQHDIERVLPEDGGPVLIMPIGCSGSGKSTFVKTMPYMFPENTITHYSLDELRHRWYDMDDYSNAFRMSCDDKSFKSNAQREFIDLVKSGVSLYCDNTNLSRKARNFYLSEAKRHGYTTIAVLLPLNRKQLMDRQASRDDKVVPAEAYFHQYNCVSMPNYGEFDFVHTHEGNLPDLT